MTTPPPVRAITARARFRTDQASARRAIDEPAAPVAVAPALVQTSAREAAATEQLFVGPGIGKPEVQLVLSFLLTAAIVFAFTVVLPLLLRLVRNF